jgi:hypothetical protein
MVKDLNLKILASSKGFTMPEILVVIFGFGLIAVGLIALVSQIFVGSNKQSMVIADSDQARRLAFGLVGEVRNAVTASTGAYPLDTAQAQQLIFYANIDTAPGVEKVRYFVQNGKLMKGVIKYNGASYPSASEQVFTVQNNLANGSDPIFTYYDGTYMGSSTQAALTQPVSVTSVKFVRLTLKVFNKAGATGKNTFTVTASGAVRNLKENLGE